MFILITLLKILIIVVPLLISVAYFTLAERKILGPFKDVEDLMLLEFMDYYNLFLTDLNYLLRRQFYLVILTSLFSSSHL